MHKVSSGVLLVGLLAMMASIAGCSVVTVKQGVPGSDPKAVAGLPFYVKTPQYTQITVYRKTWLRVVLTIEPALPSSSPMTIVRDVPKDSAELEKLKVAIAQSNFDGGSSTLSLIGSFQSLPTTTEAVVQPVAVRNGVTTELTADPGTTYYLNATMPWFGSGTITQKLAGDGTLTEVTSTADTKLAEGLSALLPLKEFLTGKLVSPLQATTDTTDPVKSPPAASGVTALSMFAAKLTLKVDEVGYEYSLSRPPTRELPKEPRIKFSEKENVFFTVTPIGGSKAQEEDKTPKIGISGSIELPEGWGGAKSE